MDPSLHPSPQAYYRAQRQSRAMVRKDYRAANPRNPLVLILSVGLFVAGMGYAVMKLREEEGK